MTIAIGILAKDGLVIAADSQETHQGFIKLDQDKLSTVLTAPDDGATERSCIIAGAGDSAHINALSDAIRKAFYQGESKDAAQIEQECADIVKGFFLERIAPFGSWPDDHRPEVRLILGSVLPKPKLLFTEKTLLQPGGHYCAVGVGSIIATPLLQRMYQEPIPSIRTAIVLAAYVMAQTKELVEGCGRSTDLSGIYHGEYFSVSRHHMRLLERAVIDYWFAVEPLMLREFTLKAIPAERRVAAQARRGLRKAVATINDVIAPLDRRAQRSPTRDPKDPTPSQG